MKNKLLIILLLISATLFSQDKDKKTLLEEMNNYYNKSKIEKLEELTNDLLSGKYGNMDDELKFYTLMYSSNVYTRDEYVKKNPQIGYDKTIELINFTKITSYQLPNKEAYLKSMDTFLLEFLKKHPEIIKTSNQNTSQSNTQSTLSSTTNTEKKAQASDNKTVTLTVSGTGKTLEEARLNALRSAIEQAFGAFISSKTEILNDNLIKDEIVSVTNGNIQKFDIISQVEIPDNGYAITLKATVSIEKLTTFAEGKGVVVEFKGGMYGLKLKLQKLNEQAEINAVKNLTSTCFEILNKSLEFELIVSEPKLAKYNTEESDIDFEVKTKVNNNFQQFNKYFIENIKNMSLNKNEVEDYKNINKDLYYLIIDGEKFHLRSKKSFKLLVNFFISSQILTNSFKIYSNESVIKFGLDDIYGNFLNQSICYEIAQPQNIFLNAFYTDYKLYSGNKLFLFYLAPFIKLFEEKMSITKDELLYNIYNSDFNTQKVNDGLAAGYGLHLQSPDLNESARNLVYYTNANAPILKFSRRFKNSEIEKINQFNIDKIDVYEFVKNRNLYMTPKLEEYYSCFIGNTKIKTPTGTKNIQDIKVGDEVICFDDKGNLHTSIVESINEHDNQEVYEYSVWNGETLYATPNHWVLTSENSFSEIGKLNEMLTLVDIKGGLKPITKVEYHGKHKVYNFIVKEYHTYIANDIRVHNGGKGKYKKNN